MAALPWGREPRRTHRRAKARHFEIKEKSDLKFEKLENIFRGPDLQAGAVTRKLDVLVVRTFPRRASHTSCKGV